MIRKAILGMVIAVALTGAATAMEMEALDRVAVLMPKSKVRLLIGAPDQYLYMGSLDVELYRLTGMEGLIGAACLYAEKELLVGQIYFFEGRGENVARDRLIRHGYTLLEAREGACRLIGRDDDTGRPLMAFIYENSDLTVIMTFEKDYYDRRIGNDGKKQ